MLIDVPLAVLALFLGVSTTMLGASTVALAFGVSLDFNDARLTIASQITGCLALSWYFIG